LAEYEAPALDPAIRDAAIAYVTRRQEALSR